MPCFLYTHTVSGVARGVKGGHVPRAPGLGALKWENESLKNKHFLEKHDEIDVCRQAWIFSS